VTTVQRKDAPLSGRTVSIVAVAAAAAIAIAGCTSFKQSMGAGKQGPDETAIATRAPLVVPATFALKPPQPGAPRPQDSDSAAAAQRVLGGTPKAAPASEGERALLSATGAATADPNVRRELGEEARESRKRKSYADTVLFWRGTRGDAGTPLDAGEEAQRMNATLPKQQAEPVIQRVDPAEPPPKAEPAKVEEEEEDDDSGGWFDWF